MLLISLAQAGPLEDCLTDHDPRDRYRCAYRVARSTNDYPTVISAVEAEVKQHPEHAWGAHTLGSLYTDAAKREQGVGWFERARTMFDNSDDVLGRVYCRLNLGNHTFHLQRFEESSRAYDEAAQIAADKNRPDLAHLAKLSHARTLVNREERLGEAWNIANEVHDPVFAEGTYQAKLLTLHVLSKISEATGRHQELQGYLQRKLDLVTAEGDQYNMEGVRIALATSLVEGQAYGHLPQEGVEHVRDLTRVLLDEGDGYSIFEAACTRSRLEWQDGQAGAALPFAERCVAAAEELNEKALLRLAWAELAFATVGDVPRSRSAWETAVNHTETPEERAILALEHIELLAIRGEGEQVGMPEVREAVAVLREAAGDRVSRSSLATGTLKFVEMAAHQLAAHDTQAALALAEITRGESSAVQVDLAEVLSRIPDDTTLVIPLLPATFDQGTAVVLTRGNSRTVPLQGILGLDARIEVLNGLITARDSTAADASRALYDVLIAPLALKKERVVFFPTGALHLLAFDALQGPNGRLGDAHILSLERSLARWHVRPPAALLEAVVVADPSAPAGGLPALPAARTEARTVAGLLPVSRKRTLIGKAATEEAVVASTGADWLHIAAHGVVNPRFPEQTALYLANGDRLTAEEIQAERWKGIVVLSACRSAGGRVLGDRPLGLSNAFYEAGADAVIGSLWPMKDSESAAFFSRFYRHIAQGLPLDEALAQTRRAIAATGAPEEAWAGVVLLGDGRISVPPGRPVLPWIVDAIALLGGLLLTAWWIPKT